MRNKTLLRTRNRGMRFRLVWLFFPEQFSFVAYPYTVKSCIALIKISVENEMIFLIVGSKKNISPSEYVNAKIAADRNLIQLIHHPKNNKHMHIDLDTNACRHKHYIKMNSGKRKLLPCHGIRMCRVYIMLHNIVYRWLILQPCLL